MDLPQSVQLNMVARVGCEIEEDNMFSCTQHAVTLSSTDQVKQQNKILKFKKVKLAYNFTKNIINLE